MHHEILPLTNEALILKAKWYRVGFLETQNCSVHSLQTQTTMNCREIKVHTVHALNNLPST